MVFQFFFVIFRIFLLIGLRIDQSKTILYSKIFNKIKNVWVNYCLWFMKRTSFLPQFSLYFFSNRKNINNIFLHFVFLLPVHTSIVRRTRTVNQLKQSWTVAPENARSNSSLKLWNLYQRNWAFASNLKSLYICNLMV